MIDICYKYGNKYGIILNSAKTNWIFTSIYHNVSFDINSVGKQCVGLSIKYLGVNLIVCNNVLTIDVEDRICKFNMAAYDVLLNTSDLNEVVRCELIFKKCLPVLLYEIGGVSITNRDIYNLHIAYRKIYSVVQNEEKPSCYPSG